MRSLLTSIPRIWLSLFAISSDATAASSDCRSNETHIIWQSPQTTSTQASFGRRKTRSSHPSTLCSVQLREDAEEECLKYLQDNIMDFDRPFQETMGFPSADSDTADGLSNGLIGPTIRLAVQAKIDFPWTDELPKHIFMDYVLNYANLNEARTNWRPLLIDAMKFNESSFWQSGDANLTSVVTW